MEKYENLVIVGTSHISKQSMNEVTEVIDEQTGIVALELDKGRFMGLLNKKKTKKVGLSYIKKVGMLGYIFALVGKYVEEKMGNVVGISPGSDMMQAYKVGTQLGCKIALIDKDINITLKNMSKTVDFREKFRFVFDMLKSLIFKKSEMKKWGFTELDLTKVPPAEIVEKMISRLSVRYPKAYKVLIKDRNKYMAHKLVLLMNKYPNVKIVAVVGAGHEKDMIQLVKANI